jgi:hypothetical protein
LIELGFVAHPVCKAGRAVTRQCRDLLRGKVDGANGVIIDGDATTDPKGISERRWSAQLKAVWDVSQGKFTSQKITRRTSKQIN